MDEVSNKGYSHLLIMRFQLSLNRLGNVEHQGRQHRNTGVCSVFTGQLLSQHVDKPTRWRGNDTPHVLELIITNGENLISSLEPPSPMGKSDHCAILLNIKCNTTVTCRSKTKTCYNKANYENINNEILKFDWINQLKESNSVNDNWALFRGIFKTYKQFIPSRIIKINRNNQHTFPVDKSTLGKIKKKHSLSKTASTLKDPAVRKEYNKTMHQVKKLTRKSLRILNAIQQIRQSRTQKWYRNILIPNQRPDIVDIGDLYQNPGDKQSTKVTTDKDKADLLAQFSTMYL